jgi:hypothetical protein
MTHPEVSRICSEIHELRNFVAMHLQSIGALLQALHANTRSNASLLQNQVKLTSQIDERISSQEQAIRALNENRLPLERIASRATMCTMKPVEQQTKLLTRTVDKIPSNFSPGTTFLQTSNQTFPYNAHTRMLLLSSRIAMDLNPLPRSGWEASEANGKNPCNSANNFRHFIALICAQRSAYPIAVSDSRRRNLKLLEF